MDDWNFDKDREDKDKGKGKDKDKDKDKGKGKAKDDKGKGKDMGKKDDDVPSLIPVGHQRERMYTPGPQAALATDEDDNLYIVDPENRTIMQVVERGGGGEKDSRAMREQRRHMEQAAILQQLMMAVAEAKRTRAAEEKVDGERTDTKGPCDCGYRHWCEGREVDFVYPIETSRGTQILGYSLTDNVYDVAEKFVIKHDIAKNTLNHNVYVQNIANKLLEITEDKYKPNIDKKPEKESTWDPTKAQFFRQNGAAHYNKEKGIFEGTMYHDQQHETEELVKERKKKEDVIKANQEKLEEEKKRKEEEAKKIQAQIKRDQDEVESDRQYRNLLKQSQEPNPASPMRKKRIIGEDGNVRFVDDDGSDSPSLRLGNGKKKTKKQATDIGSGGPATLGSLHNKRQQTVDDDSDDASSDSDSSDLEDPLAAGRVPQDDWNTDMVYRSMRIHGEQGTKRALRESGFSEEEIPRVISMSLALALRRQAEKRHIREMKRDRHAQHEMIKMQRKMMMLAAGETEPEREKEKEKAHAFAGHGHRLDAAPKATAALQTGPPTTAATVAVSTYRIDFNDGAPKTIIKVRTPSGEVKVNINLTHTVRQLFDHLRTHLNLQSNAPLKITLPPNQGVDENDSTISDAKLVNVFITLKY